MRGLIAGTNPAARQKRSVRPIIASSAGRGQGSK
nr:MAG TPA: hypothetical protein [Caudoviricetes sp.]DAU90427.1 MAG TPA: hypothetical protein [Caudoviricetes sp.]